jgi:hypothetical protein
MIKILGKLWDKCSSWYFTLSAAILSLINSFLQNPSNWIAVWLFMFVGFIKLFCESVKREREDFEMFCIEARCRWMLELLPGNIQMALADLEMDEELRAKINEVIEKEYMIIQEHEKELRDDNLHK